ncbi:hypothetical protein [Paenibacillus illinoisensis]|uniref:hypothetical protein n=1 Tax=Paenibacillus illinoisensis TaxID=59845 RepID=UPI003D975B59
MDNSIQKPLVLGKYYYGKGDMGWAWWQYNHAELAIIGDTKLSPRRQLVSDITNEITKRDPNVVFMISTETPQVGEAYTIESIPWVEGYPDPPEFFEDRNVFIEARHFFSNSYFTLMAKVLHIPRSRLLPPISFKPHLEGPLQGYRRAIESLSDDVTYKDNLLEHLLKIDKIPWVQTMDHGKRYYIEATGSVYEQALSFITAAWSFWAMTCQMDDPQQMLLIVELPKELLRYDVDPVIEKIVIETLKILKYVSIVTTTSIILSSEMLYPAPELKFRYKLFFQTEDSDINLFHENLRNMIDPQLIQEWNNGNSKVGLWMDDITSNSDDTRIVVQVGDYRPSFWDDYE